jgi:hypothetical protein
MFKHTKFSLKQRKRQIAPLAKLAIRSLLANLYYLNCTVLPRELVDEIGTIIKNPILAEDTIAVRPIKARALYEGNGSNYLPLIRFLYQNHPTYCSVSPSSSEDHNEVLSWLIASNRATEMYLETELGYITLKHCILIPSNKWSGRTDSSDLIAEDAFTPAIIEELKQHDLIGDRILIPISMAKWEYDND